MLADDNLGGIFATKCGNVCSVTVLAQSDWTLQVTSSDYVTLCTLPDSLRPIRKQSGAWVAPGSSSYGIWLLRKDGALKISKSSGLATSFYNFQFTYFCSKYDT